MPSNGETEASVTISTVQTTNSERESDAKTALDDYAKPPVTYDPEVYVPEVYE